MTENGGEILTNNTPETSIIRWYRLSVLAESQRTRFSSLWEGQMQKLTKDTLTGICTQMASHSWSEAEINELVDPQLGIITGFLDLLNELEQLRRVDLGTTPPAMSVQGADRYD